ncbi:hypothetical protein B0H19DRAFT_1068800 [Mycena capillaripes]|nr:hypothetical protein B0H19DRAFT_1068800 [Mycena capillaripes]
MSLDSDAQAVQKRQSVGFAEKDTVALGQGLEGPEWRVEALPICLVRWRIMDGESSQRLSRARDEVSDRWIYVRTPTLLAFESRIKGFRGGIGTVNAKKRRIEIATMRRGSLSQDLNVADAGNRRKRELQVYKVGGVVNDGGGLRFKANRVERPSYEAVGEIQGNKTPESRRRQSYDPPLSVNCAKPAVPKLCCFRLRALSRSRRQAMEKYVRRKAGDAIRRKCVIHVTPTAAVVTVVLMSDPDADELGRLRVRYEYGHFWTTKRGLRSKRTDGRLGVMFDPEMRPVKLLPRVVRKISFLRAKFGDFLVRP